MGQHRPGAHFSDRRWLNGIGLAPGSAFTSDELACYAAVTEAGCLHKPVVLSNLKTTLGGAVHARTCRKYAANCLGAFACRFDQRLGLRDLVASLVADVARCAPANAPVVRTSTETLFQSGGHMMRRLTRQTLARQSSCIGVFLH